MSKYEGYFKFIIGFLLVLLFSLQTSSYIQSNYSYSYEQTVEETCLFRAKQFVELYSSGSQEAFQYVSNYTERYVFDEFDVLLYDLDYYVPYPTISTWKFSETGNSSTPYQVILSFQPETSDYPVIYRYYFSFSSDLTINRIDIEEI